MTIDSIVNGIVLDHIQAGQCMKIYRYLHLDELDCVVAIVKNVKSRKMGRKDIIKVDAAIDLDLDVLGFIDPNITVNIILEEKLVEKKRLALPETLTNVLICKNPRCITATEPGIDHKFKLTDRDSRIYRCLYCETAEK